MRWLLITFFALQSASFAAEPLPMPREVRVDAFGDRLPDGVIARLGTTRFRHYGADVLTFDPSGKRFITTGRGRGVRVWDAATGALVDRWNLPRANCEALCFSADGRTAVIPSKEHLEIWDLPGGRLIQRLPFGDAPSISAACLSNDGRWLASADFTPREHRLRLWDLQTGKNRVVGTHEGSVTQILLSTDGLMLLSCSPEDNTLCAWALDKQKEAWRYSGFVWRMRLNGEGRQLLVNQMLYPKGGLSIIFDSATGKKLTKAMPIDHGDVETAISSDGSLFAIHSDGKVAVHETAGHKKLHEWRVDAKALAFAADGNALYVIESPGVVQAYSLRTGKALLPSAAEGGHTGAIGNLTWAPDGMRIATAGGDGDYSVRIWNAADGKLIHRLPNLNPPEAALEFSRDGRWLWACGNRSPLQKWDVATGKEVKKWFVVHDDDYEKPFGEIVALKMLPDEKTARALLLANEQREKAYVATLDLESGKIENAQAIDLPFPAFDHTELREYRVARSVKSFDASSGENLPDLETGDDGRHWIETRLSPDNMLVASSRCRRTLNTAVFERITGRLVFELPEIPAGRYTFSPDGRHFAVAAPDGIHIWDLAARKEVRFFKGHDRFDAHSLNSFATVIAFSPDGQRIATGHANTTILIWDAAVQLRARPTPLSMEEIERLWSDLAEPDPKKGMAAVWALQDHSEQAWKLLSERLKPVSEPVDMKEWIARLDSDNFRHREAARKRISEYGDAAGPALRAVLKGKLTEEQQKHIQKLLTDVDLKQPPFGSDLRGIRCLQILESINTPEARQIIGRLAQGLASSRVTREASDSLERCR